MSHDRLAFFGGFLVLMVVAAMIYDRRARRRGLRPGVSERDVLNARNGELSRWRRRCTGGLWAERDECPRR